MQITRIVAVEVLPTGLLVAYADETLALFSPELLADSRPAATELLKRTVADARLVKLAKTWHQWDVS